MCHRESDQLLVMLEGIILELSWCNTFAHLYKRHGLPFHFSFVKVTPNLLNVHKKEWGRSKQQCNLGYFVLVGGENSELQKNSVILAYLWHAVQPHTPPSWAWKGSPRWCFNTEEKFHWIFIMWVRPGTCITLFCRKQQWPTKTQ